MKYLISLIFFFYAFFSAILKREKYITYILIFVLPFQAAPFKNFKFPLFLGLSSFIIIGMSLGRLIRKSFEIYPNRNTLKEISTLNKWMLFFLFLSIILPLLSNSYNPLIYPEMLYSYVNFNCYFIILILFINIFPSNIIDLDKLMLVFNLSVLINVLAYVALKVNVPLLPDFLIANPFDGSSKFYRFQGLIGDFELMIDYLMIVIGFSIRFIYINRYKIASVITLICAIILALLTGTRSFLVVLSLFLMFNSILVLSKSKVKYKMVTIAILAGFAISAILFYKFLYSTNIMEVIFSRTLDSLGLLQSGSLEKAANRDWTNSMSIVIENAGFFGHGAFLSTSFYDHVMIAHCLYFDIYSKFGVLGLVALIFMFAKILKMSYSISNKYNKIPNREFIFTSLFIALAIQELKISALRYVTSVLIYGFFLSIILLFYKYDRFSLDVTLMTGKTAQRGMKI